MRLNRSPRYAAIVVVSLLSLASAACEAPRATAAIPADCEFVRVTRVTDGDTIHVELGGRDEFVRYIGVDAPETVKPDTPVQPYGPEATAFNIRLVRGQEVCLERGIVQRDRFGRVLAYVWLRDGTLVNEAMLREGLAVVSTFPPDVKYVDSRYLPAQRAAQHDRKNLWSR